MARTLQLTQAARSAVLTESGFSGYDHCINPYVGCQFGCKYCYVRFFVKDPKVKWGEFVRLREHLASRLPRELAKTGPTRIVIGTMTDPYQPVELKYRLTRSTLQILATANPPMTKVGIYTRSPLVMQDVDLIRQLPKGRVHFTITPYPKDILAKIEPVPVLTEARFRVIEQLKKAGLRVNVNVAPVLPIYSEPYTEDYAKRLAQIGVDEFFVDPMQPYRESLDSIREAMAAHQHWDEVEAIISNKRVYDRWKEQYKQTWLDAWKKHGDPKTLAIMADHISHTKIDMNTGKQLDWKKYGDDLI